MIPEPVLGATLPTAQEVEFIFPALCSGLSHVFLWSQSVSKHTGFVMQQKLADTGGRRTQRHRAPQEYPSLSVPKEITTLHFPNPFHVCGPVGPTSLPQLLFISSPLSPVRKHYF